MELSRVGGKNYGPSRSQFANFPKQEIFSLFSSGGLYFGVSGEGWGEFGWQELGWVARIMGKRGNCRRGSCSGTSVSCCSYVVGTIVPSTWYHCPLYHQYYKKKHRKHRLVQIPGSDRERERERCIAISHVLLYIIYIIYFLY